MSAAFTNSDFGNPPSEMEELLRGAVDRAVCQVLRRTYGSYAGSPARLPEKLRPMLDSVLRESGLLRLLEAGQANYHALRSYEHGNSALDLAREGCANYEIALAEMKEKIR